VELLGAAAWCGTHPKSFKAAYPLSLSFEISLLSCCFDYTYLAEIIPSLFAAMVRHKKDNFSRGGKRAGPPRHRPSPRGADENNDAEGGAARPPFKAACWDFGHCDPKRCSGKRLINFGLMRELSIGHKHPGVIISYELALASGIVEKERKLTVRHFS
jgi:Possible Fer4-like domain in RNase L inhibitor, RLI